MSKDVEPVYKQLGERIRWARELRGWTQERLGLALRPTVTRAAIANMETGKQRILLHIALDISKVLGFAPAQILGLRKP